MNMEVSPNNAVAVEPKQEHNFNSINPFIEPILEHISEQRYRKAIGHTYQEVLDQDSGELKAQKVLVLGEQKKVDKQEWYKVYNGAMKKFFGLSSKTAEIFEYIMANIRYGNDKICLQYGDINEQVSVSKSSYYRAIGQLLDASIIAKADREGCYFINPAIAFKGDRITLAKQYILDTDKPAITEQ